MRVETLSISRDVLMRMPPAERAFFLLCGHFINEIIVLSKLCAFTNDIPAGGSVQSRAGVTQALVVNKLLIGKLNEGWNLIDRRYYATALSREYDERLHDDGREALNQLTQYFRRPTNVIRTMRNRFSFHYLLASFDATLPEMNDSEFEIHIGQQKLNSLYYLSECAVNIAMLREFGDGELRSIFDRVYGEIITAHGWFLTFAEDFMTACLGRYLGEPLERIRSGTVEIDDAPNLNEVRMPYFVEVPQ